MDNLRMRIVLVFRRGRTAPQNLQAFGLQTGTRTRTLHIKDITSRASMPRLWINTVRWSLDLSLTVEVVGKIDVRRGRQLNTGSRAQCF